MGVKGLWQLLDTELDSSDLFIDLQDLDNKILAIDVSIWLYQYVRTIQFDSSGRINPLIFSGLFQRICKLLHFGVKPIFVFDGNAPSLKKEVVKLRKDIRNNAETDHSKIAKKILRNKLKMDALEKLDLNNNVSNKLSHSNSPIMRFKDSNSPPIDSLIEESDISKFSDFDSDDDGFDSIDANVDMIDTTSSEFKKLPFDIQEQILLKFRKRTIDPFQLIENIQNQSREEDSSDSPSPKKGDSAIDFSKAQIDALIKRRKLMNELESLRVGNSEVSTTGSLKLGNIASSSEKKYLFVKNVRAGWSLSLDQQEQANGISQDKVETNKNIINEHKKTKTPNVNIDDDLEFMQMMFGSRETEDNGGDLMASDNRPSEAMIQSFEPSSNTFVPNNPISVVSNDDINIFEELRFNIPTNRSSSNLKTKTDSGDFFEIESKDPLLPQDEPDVIKYDEYDIENNRKAPEMIEKNKRKVNEDNEGYKIDSFTSNSHSPFSDILLDEEYIDFFQQVSSNDDSSKFESDQTPNYSLLIEKIQEENLRYNSLGEVAITSSSAPTKKLTDLFMEMIHFFNLPLLDAPFEAEAQCAFLNGIDGIISDDSDCLLFGAKVVYRHFFNSGKSGMQKYDIRKIHSRTGLSKEDFIVLAHLLGCDYCPGISGIGPKRAYDILKAIKKDTIDPLNTSQALSQILQFSKDENSTYFKLLSDKIPSNFGDSRVTDAFINPIVNDIDPSTFKWGNINEMELRRFMFSHAGWSHEKTDSYIRTLNKNKRKI